MGQITPLKAFSNTYLGFVSPLRHEKVLARALFGRGLQTDC
jgi:hypothetical protein